MVERKVTMWLGGEGLGMKEGQWASSVTKLYCTKDNQVLFGHLHWKILSVVG